MSPTTQELREITAGSTYPHDGHRLFFPAGHVSLVIPRQCTGAALLTNVFQIKRKASAIEGILYLHQGGDLLDTKWFDKDIEEQGETLRPTAEAKVEDGVITREFVSPSHRGCRLKVDDVWGNGVSAIFRGLRKETPAIRGTITRVLDSLRFIQRECLSEAQTISAITAYLNAKGDLRLYVDRHFYLVRDEVIETFRVFSKQAQLEGHAAADVATARLKFLFNAREAIDRGVWDLEIADLRLALKRIQARSPD
jgi:hypothetical protein